MAYPRIFSGAVPRQSLLYVSVGSCHSARAREPVLLLPCLNHARPHAHARRHGGQAGGARQVGGQVAGLLGRLWCRAGAGGNGGGGGASGREGNSRSHTLNWAAFCGTNHKSGGCRLCPPPGIVCENVLDNAEAARPT